MRENPERRARFVCGLSLVSMLAFTACLTGWSRDGGAAAATPTPAASSCAAAARCADATWDAARLQQLVDEAHAKFEGVKDGKNADYIPILTTVPSKLFGVVIVTRDGQVFAAGDTDYRFSIQSVAKPFTAALVMQQAGGPGIILEKVGVEPTGLPFNSKLAIELLSARSVNPLVNAGAIATVSLVEAATEAERWSRVLGNLQGFAGDADLPLLDAVYQSEYDTAFSNRAIANLLFNYGRLYADPEETLRVYTQQSSVGVSAAELGMMGATLANGGVNPKTGTRMLDESSVPELLAIMLTAGFYDESGRWAYSAGLPAKTGVGGGVVAVVPGQLAIAAFSPRLNAAGNSVRAQLAIRYIAGQLGVGVFGANPD